MTDDRAARPTDERAVAREPDGSRPAATGEVTAVGVAPTGGNAEAVSGDTDPGVGGPPDGTDDDGGDGGGGPGGLTWGKVAILGVALAFLGFAAGMFVSRDDPPPADSVDVGFLQDMITHHDQGIGVARLAAAYAEDQTVRSYAREILTAQSYEMGLMSQKLAEWGHTSDERSDEAMAWMGMPVPVDQMPGLLTAEQLDQIESARGAEMDALFLELMAEHHRGGLHMAQAAASTAGDEWVRELASRIEHAQSGEINEYRQTARDLGLDIDIPGADVPPTNLPDRED